MEPQDLGVQGFMTKWDQICPGDILETTGPIS